MVVCPITRLAQSSKLSERVVLALLMAAALVLSSMVAMFAVLEEASSHVALIVLGHLALLGVVLATFVVAREIARDQEKTQRDKTQVTEVTHDYQPCSRD